MLKQLHVELKNMNSGDRILTAEPKGFQWTLFKVCGLPHRVWLCWESGDVPVPGGYRVSLVFIWGSLEISNQNSGFGVIMESYLLSIYFIIILDNSKQFESIWCFISTCIVVSVCESNTAHGDGVWGSIRVIFNYQVKMALYHTHDHSGNSAWHSRYMSAATRCFWHSRIHLGVEFQ